MLFRFLAFFALIPSISRAEFPIVYRVDGGVVVAVAPNDSGLAKGDGLAVGTAKGEPPDGLHDAMGTPLYCFVDGQLVKRPSTAARSDRMTESPTITSVCLESPDGSLWDLTVDDDGNVHVERSKKKHSTAR